MQHVTVCMLSSITFLYIAAVVCAENTDSQSALEAAISRVENENVDKRGWNELSGMWGKRGWNNLQGVWGKRGWNNLQGVWGKRGWNNLQNLWGKRNWNNLQGMWGKRGWNNLQGVWGKRDADNTADKKNDWNKLTGMWGKRSSLGWRIDPSLVDLYSVEEEDPEVLKQMMS